MPYSKLDEVKAIIERRFGLSQVEVRDLNVPVNDVFEITSPHGKFALKLYNIRSRSLATVRWEMDLLRQLRRYNAPISYSIESTSGFEQLVKLEGTDRVGVLFEWAPGQKPQPSRETYLMIGESAARIHAATEAFSSTQPRERYDLEMLIDEQITRMSPMLEQTGQLHRMQALGGRLREHIGKASLDTGICHMDLTLDNVHVQDDSLTVFDFDSAAWSWRAIEPHGVLQFSERYFRDWLEGYRTVRPFDIEDERMVYVFAIVGAIRNVAWKLGLANSSRGQPLLYPDDLPDVIDNWLQWEREHIWQ